MQPLIVTALASAFAAILLTWFLTTLPNLRSLFRCTGTTTSTLPVPVSRLSPADVASIILLIGLKYVSNLFGQVPELKVEVDGAHFVLPRIMLTAKLQVDRGDEERFDAAARAEGSGKPPRTNRLMLLPALVNPLMSTLLANRNCPVFPFGCVNTKNTFKIIDKEACRDPAGLDLSKTVVIAYMGGPDMKGRRVKRGMEFDVEIVVVVSKGHDSNHGEEVFKQVGTVLAYLSRSNSKPVLKQSQPVNDHNYAWSTTTKGKISFGLLAPRLWAAVCKDYNPIHMSTLLARLFGFPGKIAHGNHVLACAIEQLGVIGGSETGAEEDMRKLLRGDDPLTLDVTFKRPMVLPTDLGVDFGSGEEGFGLRVVRGGKEHVTAHMAPLH